MHCPDYDTDRLCRSVYLSDLYVEKAARKRGIGRALMAAVAHEGRSRGARIMMWGVLRHNDLARDFYRTIGEEQPKLIGTFIGGPELSQLAAWNSTATDISVRSAVAGDSALLAAWLRALLADIDEPPPPEDAESRIRADGFGRDPAFTALIAERAAVPLGYTLYWPTYDTETAGRGLWLSDLYVVPGARRSNVGRILMAALARRAVAGDASFINFLVLERNQRARAFYRTIGQEWHEGYACLCAGERFNALADEAPAIA
jgi:ribosomal protein S18 acetylase RimI-like enzyme